MKRWKLGYILVANGRLGLIFRYTESMEMAVVRNGRKMKREEKRKSSIPLKNRIITTIGSETIPSLSTIHPRGRNGRKRRGGPKFRPWLRYKPAREEKHFYRAATLGELGREIEELSGTRCFDSRRLMHPTVSAQLPLPTIVAPSSP